MLILTVGVVVALVLRAFWRQILEVAILCILVAVFVGILTLVQLGQNGLGG